MSDKTRGRDPQNPPGAGLLGFNNSREARVYTKAKASWGEDGEQETAIVEVPGRSPAIVELAPTDPVNQAIDALTIYVYADDAGEEPLGEVTAACEGTPHNRISAEVLLAETEGLDSGSGEATCMLLTYRHVRGSTFNALRGASAFVLEPEGELRAEPAATKDEGNKGPPPTGRLGFNNTRQRTVYVKSTVKVGNDDFVSSEASTARGRRPRPAVSDLPETGLRALEFTVTVYAELEEANAEHGRDIGSLTSRLPGYPGGIPINMLAAEVRLDFTPGESEEAGDKNATMYVYYDSSATPFDTVTGFIGE